MIMHEVINGLCIWACSNTSRCTPRTPSRSCPILHLSCSISSDLIRSHGECFVMVKDVIAALLIVSVLLAITKDFPHQDQAG